MIHLASGLLGRKKREKKGKKEKWTVSLTLFSYIQTKRKTDVLFSFKTKTFQWNYQEVTKTKLKILVKMNTVKEKLLPYYNSTYQNIEADTFVHSKIIFIHFIIPFHFIHRNISKYWKSDLIAANIYINILPNLEQAKLQLAFCIFSIRYQKEYRCVRP